MRISAVLTAVISLLLVSTVADVNLVKAQVGSALTSANFRTDVNTTGGMTVADLNLVKAQVGTSLP